MEKATISATAKETSKRNKTIVLKEYHSIEYLKKISNGEDVVFILPNGKEIKINDR